MANETQDIIERLRADNKQLRYRDQQLKIAQAEMERLRMERDAAHGRYIAERAKIQVVRAATIEECGKPLEQIRQVCADNAGEASNHKMALDFVHQIAIRALKEQK